jgi:hypothetical protein
MVRIEVSDFKYVFHLKKYVLCFNKFVTSIFNVPYLSMTALQVEQNFLINNVMHKLP